MIRTVFRISVLRLWNTKQELLLALVVPILFFSIFAMIFGRGVGSGASAISVAIVDDDRSSLTENIANSLADHAAIDLDVGPLYTNQQWPLEELTAAVMRRTNTDVIIHLPANMERDLRSQSQVQVRLLSEGTNPVGRQVVSAMVTQAIGKAAQNRLSAAPPSPSAQRDQTARVSNQPLLRLPPTAVDSAGPASEPIPRSEPPRNPLDLVSIATTEVFAGDKHNPKIAMYAAGIAVMFLLFSATGAGGSLLEEYEAGTLDRLLSSQLSVTELLAGKWLFITCLGAVQLSIMFTWAQLAFGVDLWNHLPGFAVMAFATAAATASLALCLAVLCRSRAQLNGVSIVLILTMSALGGSMVPRYIMSDEMRQWGQLTFNAWALDGFKKVFWYNLPVRALQTEVKVLLGMAVTLACIARLLADRWAAD